MTRSSYRTCTIHVDLGGDFLEFMVPVVVSPPVSSHHNFGATPPLAPSPARPPTPPAPTPAAGLSRFLTR